MTTVPASRLQLQFKVRPPVFNEEDHPRDRKGRFIETGAEVRIWGGQLATVLRNVGGGKIEVQRKDGQKVVVHRNYLTVVARPDGSAPTDQTGDVSAAPVEAPSPDAAEVPELADGENQALPDRGDAPDHLVTNPTVGEQVGDYTVGEYLDGPSSIDGWVVGTTDQGGPIVRTEDGQDWPLLPDAQVARNTENAPEVPGGLMDEVGAPDAPADSLEDAMAQRDQRREQALARLRSEGVAQGDESEAAADAIASTTGMDEADRFLAGEDLTGDDYRALAHEMEASADLTPDRADAFNAAAEAMYSRAGDADAQARGTTDAPPAAAPDAPTPDVAPTVQPIDSVNPGESGDSGVFADYASGREYRASAPLADNMTTLAETEDHDPADPVTLYRGVAEGDPNDGIQPGDFVTTNRQLAHDYAGTGQVVETQATYGDVLDDRTEPGGEEYIYRPQVADVAPETQAPERQTPEAPQGPEEAAPAPETPGPTPEPPAEPVQAPETPGQPDTVAPDAPDATETPEERRARQDAQREANLRAMDFARRTRQARTPAAMGRLRQEADGEENERAQQSMLNALDERQAVLDEQAAARAGRPAPDPATTPRVDQGTGEVTVGGEHVGVVSRDGRRAVMGAFQWTARADDGQAFSGATRKEVVDKLVTHVRGDAVMPNPEFVPDATASPDAPATQERDLTALSDDDLGAAADAAQTVEEVRAIADEYRRRTDALDNFRLPEDQRRERTPEESQRQAESDLSGDIAALDADASPDLTIAPDPAPTPAEAARARLEAMADEQAAAGDVGLRQMLDSPTFAITENGGVAIYRRGQSPEWTMVETGTGVPLGVGLEAEGTPRQAMRRAEAVAAIDFPWEDARNQAQSWRSAEGRNIQQEGAYRAGAVDTELGKDTPAARYYASEQPTPDPEPVEADPDRALLDSAEAGDQVTIHVPGVGEHIFTLGEDGRWHKGTTDERGSSTDEVWTAYVRVRDSRSATLAMGGWQGPFGRGQGFDPATDPRLADIHDRLVRARSADTPLVERVGLYGTLQDEVSGYRAGTRGEGDFTPEEHRALVDFRQQLISERQTLLDNRDSGGGTGDEGLDINPRPDEDLTNMSSDDLARELSNVRRQIEANPDDTSLTERRDALKLEQDSRRRPSTMSDDDISAELADMRASLYYQPNSPRETALLDERAIRAGRSGNDLPPLPDTGADMSDYQTVDDLNTAIANIDANVPILTEGSDEWRELRAYRGRLVAEAVQRNGKPRRNFGRGATDAARVDGYEWGTATMDDVAVGDVIVVKSRGGVREARITSKGRSRVTVEYTTDGAVTEQRRIREHFASQDPEGVRRTWEGYASTTWDSKNQQSTPEGYGQAIPDWMMAPEGSSGIAGYRLDDGTKVYGEEARAAYIAAGTARIEAAREFIEANPGRDAYVREVAQGHYDDAMQQRDRARMASAADDERNAHVTTYTASINDVAIKRTAGDGEKPVAPPPPPPPPIAEDVQALLDQVLADKSLPDNVRQRRATALSDRLTIMHKGLIVHRKVDGDREFVVATPDGFKHIVQDCRTQQHAIEMIDALTAITDADGNPFDWTNPGLQERIRETKGPNGESVGRMVASARAGVTVRRRKPDEWSPPVLPYGMSIGDLAPDSVHPNQNPDPQARREAFRKMVTFSDPKSGWYTDMGRIGPNGRDGFLVKGMIRNSDGQPVGKVIRSVYMNSNGEMEAHHDYLAITGQQQGQGFADAYYKHLYDSYDRQGVDVVTIQANIDVGGYAWARRGFGWDPAKHSVNRNSGYDNAFKSRADSNLARAAQQRDLTEAQRARIEKFREDLRTNTDWTPNQIANALSDIQWDAQTSGGKTVKMWPGKAAMLGTNWYGKFYIREREGQIDVPDPGPISRIPKGDIPSMSDEDLRNEAETLSRMGTEFVNDGVTGDALDALNARKANLMQEREARIQTASKALIPDGIDKSVEDLRPGDSVVVPIITERGPQLATVRGITTSDGGMTTVEVQYDDGEVRNVYLIGDMLAAKWRTGAPAHPMATPDTLAEGDRVALDDGTTAVVRGVERDGDEYVVDLMRDDGSALDLIVDRDGTVPRVSSYAETYTDPADMLDDEVDEEARRLSMRRVVDRETLSPEETQRLVALRAESERRRAAPVDMVYGDAPTARPRLYTYQRQNLVALNLDGRNSDAPDDVKQAALRVRNRMPLSAAQSRALADHLRTTTAGDDSLGVRQQRSRERLAVAFDISAAVAEGRAYRPSQPIHNEVTRVRPAGLTSGDTAIMRMADGSLQTVKVLSSRPMMRGTLVRMSVEREDGTIEDRIVDRDTDAWLMPDLDTSPAPTDVEQVGRELVSVNDVHPGDLLSIFRNGRDEQIRVGSIALDRDGDFVVTAAGAEGEGDNPLTVDLFKDSLAHRLERGPESGTPGFSALLPDGDVETIDPYDVKSGDYVEFPTQGIRGTVLAVRDLGDGRDASGNAVSTRSALVVGEDGRTQPILLPQGGRPVTRYSTAANNVGDDIAVQFEAQRQRSTRNNARGWVDAVQRRAGASAGYMLEDLDNGKLNRAEAISRLFHAADQQRMAFENRSTATNLWNNLAFDLPKMTPEQENQGNIGMQTVVARVGEDAMGRLRLSIEEAQPLPDETETDMLRRILTQWRDDPPKRNTDAMVQSVMDSLPGFTSSDRQQAIGDVALRPDAPLGERMKAYRSKIGGAFGMGQSSKARYANFTAESLERGEVPEVKAETTAQRERATDGGPAQVAMDHLATVRAAGAEVGAEVDARYERHLSDSLRAPDGMEPRREGESVNDFHLRVNTYIDDLAGQRDRAFAELNDARKRAQDIEAQVRGYADFEDVRTQFFRTSRTPQQRTDFFEIRELGGPNDPAPNPQIKSFDEQWKALKAKHEAAHALALSNRMAAATARRKAVMEVLGEIRPTGGVRLDYQQPDPTRRGRGRATSRPNGSGAALTDRSALVQSMRQAEDVYPTEWLEALRADLPNRYGGRTAIGLGPLQRGHADWAGNIRLSQSSPGFEGDNGTGGVAVHELGHLMERSTPGLLAAQEAFLWSRTSTGEVGSRQRERVTRISGREVGYKDEFASHYTGRSYAAQTSTMGVGTAHESYEVFTTGIESLYAGSEYLDDDFRAFMLGVLAVL